MLCRANLGSTRLWGGKLLWTVPLKVLACARKDEVDCSDDAVCGCSSCIGGGGGGGGKEKGGRIAVFAGGGGGGGGRGGGGGTKDLGSHVFCCC